LQSMGYSPWPRSRVEDVGYRLAQLQQCLDVDVGNSHL